MNVYGSTSTLATAYETITLSQTKLGESPTLPHRLRLVLRATALLGADYRLLGSTMRRPEREYYTSLLAIVKGRSPTEMY
jgi:hypothetical protein